MKTNVRAKFSIKSIEEYYNYLVEMYYKLGHCGYCPKCGGKINNSYWHPHMGDPKAKWKNPSCSNPNCGFEVFDFCPKCSYKMHRGGNNFENKWECPRCGFESVIEGNPIIATLRLRIPRIEGRITQLRIKCQRYPKKVRDRLNSKLAKGDWKRFDETHDNYEFLLKYTKNLLQFIKAVVSYYESTNSNA